jgi:alpha-L-fucosidase 2
MTIGRRQHSRKGVISYGYSSFEGCVDEVRIYSRALSLEDCTILAAGEEVKNGLDRICRFDKVPGHSGSVTLTKGRSGNALRFVGGDESYAETDPIWLPLDEVSVAVWIRLEQIGRPQFILSTSPIGVGINLWISAEGKLCWRVASRRGDEATVTTSQTLPKDEWIHIVGVNGPNGSEIYLNGKPATLDKSIELGDHVLASKLPAGAGSKAIMAVRVIGCPAKIADGELQFVISPGQTATLMTSILSDRNEPAYKDCALKRLNAATHGHVDALNAQHRKWWCDFYSKSFIRIPDKLIERYWYSSLYLLACCSRTGQVAPGLWGNWITDPGHVAWHGDYTLNYNYQATFWGAFVSNHIELTDCYDKPLLDWMPIARVDAEDRGYSGLYYPTHIGPLPGGSADSLTLGQKHQGLYATVNCLLRWQFTRDIEYAKKVYLFLKGVAEFWQSYLRYENGRYNDVNDAVLEDFTPNDLNPTPQLGMLRMLFGGLVDISSALKIDVGLRKKWQHICEHLAPFPTESADTIKMIFLAKSTETTLAEFIGAEKTRGRIIFRYTEKGCGWSAVNSVGIQHIFPCTILGLESDPQMIEVARNSVDMKGEVDGWFDNNAAPSLFPAAARIGYNPETILSKLHERIEKTGGPNLHITAWGGGVENLSIVPSCLGEMLLQSHQGIIRIFSNWPSDQDASFGNLRACGNFLVSAKFTRGMVEKFVIKSGGGGDCVIRNPWPRRKIQLMRNKRTAEICDGDRIRFQTSPGEEILVHQSSIH